MFGLTGLKSQTHTTESSAPAGTSSSISPSSVPTTSLETSSEIIQDPNELYHCGMKLWKGMRSKREGVKYLQQAADRGHVEAQYQLYQIYEYGLGIETNYEKAQELLQLAARTQRDAQYVLGFKYLKGSSGFSRNEHEAERYFNLSAAQGNRDAHYALANFPSVTVNEGVKEYTDLQLRHLSDAAELGHSKARQDIKQYEKDMKLRAIPIEERLSCCCFMLCFDCCSAKDNNIGLLKHEFNTIFFCCCSGPLYIYDQPTCVSRCLCCLPACCVGYICGPIWCISGACTRQSQRTLLNHYIACSPTRPSLEIVWKQCWQGEGNTNTSL